LSKHRSLLLSLHDVELAPVLSGYSQGGSFDFLSPYQTRVRG